MEAKIISCTLIVFLTMLYTCNQRNITEFSRKFMERKSKYQELIQFLMHHKKELSDSRCIKEKNLNIVIDMGMVNDGCFPGIGDSIKHYFKSNLFETIEYVGKDCWLFTLERKTGVLNYTEKYYLYSKQNGFPKALMHWKYKEKLEAQWWYVQHTDALD
jgi:hypothetical protein